ncbi:MAG: DUF2997 domain-containing protein [Planctomycetes bacterium]|nr:DUF2997 domain-containing protein [Planctomycetota bacterium]
MQCQIQVTISADGAVEVQVKGYAGPGCRDLTRRLETSLGQTMKDRTTAEFTQTEERDRRLQAGP